MSRFPLRVAVLISGRGSNLQALIAAQRAAPGRFEIVLAASNRVGAAGLRHAEDAGIATLALDPAAHGSRADYDRLLFERIAVHTPDLIVLAGFMRILDPGVLIAWQGKMINIHPSLLPKYAGLHTHRRALEAGDTQHGASVHFVSAELDGGPLIAQVDLLVAPDDTPERLASRLLPLEHALLCASVELFADQRVALDAQGVRVDGKTLQAPMQWDGTRRAWMHGA
ncbi:MAG: phosphoribosylglycinamide formyltransferase [Tahibacter sp.]